MTRRPIQTSLERNFWEGVKKRTSPNELKTPILSSFILAGSTWFERGRETKAFSTLHPSQNPLFWSSLLLSIGQLFLFGTCFTTVMFDTWRPRRSMQKDSSLISQMHHDKFEEGEVGFSLSRPFNALFFFSLTRGGIRKFATKINGKLNFQVLYPCE